MDHREYPGIRVEPILHHFRPALGDDGLLNGSFYGGCSLQGIMEDSYYPFWITRKRIYGVLGGFQYEWILLGRFLRSGYDWQFSFRLLIDIRFFNDEFVPRTILILSFFDSNPDCIKRGFFWDSFSPILFGSINSLIEQSYFRIMSYCRPLRQTLRSCDYLLSSTSMNS